MSPLHIVRDSLTVLVGGLLLVLSGVAVAGAHDVSDESFLATHGSAEGYKPVSGTFTGRPVIETTMEWRWEGGCTPDAPHYSLCSGAHRVFEQQVVMSNHQSVSPEEYQWAKWPEAYNTTLPGTVYLDTQASDDPKEQNWAVGTLDADLIATNSTYHAMIVGTEDNAGPNWFKVSSQIGDNDQGINCGITASPNWCMLYPHAGGITASFKHHFVLPGSIFFQASTLGRTLTVDRWRYDNFALTFRGRMGQRIALGVANSTVAASKVSLVPPGDTGRLWDFVPLTGASDFVEPVELPLDGTY